MVYLYAIVGLTAGIAINEVSNITSEINEKIKEKKAILKSKNAKEQLSLEVTKLSSLSDDNLSKRDLVLTHNINPTNFIVDSEQKDKVKKLYEASQKALKKNDFRIDDNCFSLQKRGYLKSNFNCNSLTDENMYFVQDEIIVNTSNDLVNEKINEKVLPIVVDKIINKKTKELEIINKKEINYEKEKFQAKLERRLELEENESQIYSEIEYEKKEILKEKVMQKITVAEDLKELPAAILKNPKLKDLVQKRINR